VDEPDLQVRSKLCGPKSGKNNTCKGCIAKTECESVMPSKVYSAAVVGIDAFEVEIEVHAGWGNSDKIAVVGLPDTAGPMLFSKAIQALNKHTIRIVRAISAITIIPQSNTRIRTSYDCMLFPPPSEIRLGEAANPLAFTSQFYNG
jgi:hypothetical protein